jgi:hypothetical protein
MDECAYCGETDEPDTPPQNVSGIIIYRDTTDFGTVLVLVLLSP